MTITKASNDNRQRPAEFDKAVKASLPFLYKHAMRVTKGNVDGANDLVQETMLKVLTHWRNYRPGTNIRTWLFWRMMSTTKETNKHKLSAMSVGIEDYHSTTDAKQESAVAARIALSELTDSREDWALVRIAMGDKLSDIGDHLGLSKQRVKQIADRAREDYARRIHYRAAGDLEFARPA